MRSRSRLAIAVGQLRGTVAVAIARVVQGSDAPAAGAPGGIVASRGRGGVARLAVLFATATCALLALNAPAAFALTTHELEFTFNGSDAPNGPFSPVGADAVDQSTGDVYVLNRGSNVIDKFNADGTYAGVQITGASTPQGALSLYYISGVAVDNSGGANNGDVYVSDTNNGVVDRFSSTGAYLCQITGAATPSASECNGVSGSNTPAGSITPAGVAVDSSGDLYVADQSNDVVDEFGPSGNYITQIANPNITSPGTIALDPSGNLYLTNISSDGVNVIEFDPAGAFVGTLDSNGSSAVGVDPATGHVYVADSNGTINEYDETSALVDSFGSSGDFVVGLAVSGSTGDVYADDLAHSVVDVYGPLVTTPDVTTGQASDVTTTGATLNGTVNPDGTAITDCHFDYVDDADYQPSASNPYSAGKTAACATTPAGSSPVAVSANVSSLTPATVYHFRLVAANANGSTAGSDQTFATGARVDAEYATSVTADSATLGAQINPLGVDTTYHFEYGSAGPCASNPCTSVPVPDADIGSGSSDVTVTQQIQSLQTSTTYHCRVVATTSAGSIDGPDRTFTTQPLGVSFALPDGRAYEMVSPVNTNGADAVTEFFGWDTRSSASGDAVTYRSFGNGFANAQGVCFAAQYLSIRGSAGWSTYAISPPQASTPNPVNACSATPYLQDYFTSDLSKGLLFHADPPLTADAPLGEDNLYVVDVSNPASPSYQVVTNVVPPGNSPYTYDTLDFPAPTVPSANFGEVVFYQADSLTAGAPLDTGNVYAWAGGKLYLVSVGPDGKPITVGATPGAYEPGSGPTGDAGGGGGSDQSNAVSADGSRVFLSSPINPFGDTPIYVRENPTAPQSPLGSSGQCTVSTDACTLAVSASQCTSASNCTTGLGSGTYRAATSDGSQALFTSRQELTNDANTGSGDQGNDLYEWDGGALTDLTPDANPADASGAGVQGVVGESQDLSYVYFVADGDLAQGGTSGQNNLYLYHGGTTTFIATLAPGNSGECSVDDSCLWATNPNLLTGRVTPDGTHLAFVSQASLTGYDNTDASTGQPDTEVYLYDANTGKLTCTSCNPTGARPAGPSTLGDEGEQNHLPTNLSDDGTQVFFQSSDALLPGVSNGNVNVYEWEADGAGSCQSSADGGGCLYLLDPGDSAADTIFLDADPTGDNVFLATRNRLLPEQQQDQITIYDVRVCTSGDPCIAPSASPPVVQCSGDGCRGPLGAPPPSPTAASVTFSGPGNSTAPAAKVKVTRKTVKGTAFKLTVKVPAKGRISASGADVKTAGRSVERGGTYKLTLRLTHKARRALKRKHRLKVTVRVRYTPSDGTASTATVAITVKS